MNVLEKLLETTDVHFDILRNNSQNKKFEGFKDHIKTSKNYYDLDLVDYLNSFYLCGLGERYKDRLIKGLNEEAFEMSKRILAGGIGLILIGGLHYNSYINDSVDSFGNLGFGLYLLVNAAGFIRNRLNVKLFEYHLSGKDFEG